MYKVSIDKIRIATAELPECIKAWMLELPDTLIFDESVTLIVGDNGEGKTSFARALVHAIGQARIAGRPEGRSMILWLNDGEPAQAIAEALSVSVDQSQQGPIITAFIEGAEIMYKSREWAQQMSYRSAVTADPEAENHRLSSRQLFDQSVEHVKALRIDRHRQRVGGDVFAIFDEPEQGLSPQGQMELPQKMTDYLDAGDHLLVPTNNVVLYLSDLPRLDLARPERGVHRPSAFGEGGQIHLPHPAS